MNKNWRLIRVANEEILNIPPHVTDYLAVETVLRSCASGMSMGSIAKIEDLPVDVVEEIIKDFFGTTGWEEDLDMNTLLIFDRVKGSYKVFSSEMEFLPITLSKDDRVKAFYLCWMYNKIKKEIRKHYE